MLLKKLSTIILIPLVSILLFTACTNEEENTDNTVVNYETETLSKDKVPFARLDKPPIPLNCQELTNPSEIKQCTSNAIMTYVTENFNIKAVSEFAKEGEIRIYVRFIIDNTGSIKNVQARAPSKELEEEAIRVIKSIPAMIPGEKDGKKVNAQYSLPIKFII